MATLFPPHVDTGSGWSAAEWSLADDDARDHVKPAIGDTVRFTANSGTMTVDENTAALTNLDMTGYVQTLNNNGGNFTIDIDNLGGATAIFAGAIEGHAIAVSGSFEKQGTHIGTAGDTVTITQNAAGAGNPTIKTNGETSGYDYLVINNAGVTTCKSNEAGSDVAAWASLNIVSAVGVKYDFNGKEHEIGGHIVLGAAATIVADGMLSQRKSGNFSCGTLTNRPAHVRLGWGAGVISTLTAHSFCTKLSTGIGTVTSGAFAFYLYIYSPTANNFLVQNPVGTLSVASLYINLNGNSRSNGVLDISNVSTNTAIWGLNGDVLTMTGDVTCGGQILRVGGQAVGLVSLDMNGYRLLGSPVIELGHTAGAAALGKIFLHNAIHEIASIQATRADQNGNEIDFGSSYCTFSGTILGERDAGKKITFTNTAAEVWGGTFTSCDLSGTNTLYPHGSIDGGGNDNIVFESSPRSMLMLMGAGR